MFASYKFQRTPTLRFCFCSKVLPDHLLYFRFSIYFLPFSRALEFVLPLFNTFFYMYRLHDKLRSVFLFKIFFLYFSTPLLSYADDFWVIVSAANRREVVRSYSERKMVFRKNIEKRQGVRKRGMYA